MKLWLTRVTSLQKVLPSAQSQGSGLLRDAVGTRDCPHVIPVFAHYSDTHSAPAMKQTLFQVLLITVRSKINKILFLWS